MSTVTSSQEGSLTPPRAAAISGIVFALLTIVGLGLVRYAIPVDLELPGNWLLEPNRRRAVSLALDMVPFAGIAFLWFMGVLRSRLGPHEDQFFATVFLGSGFLFVAAMFGSAAMTVALIESAAGNNIASGAYFFGRGVSDALLNLFAMKMAGVFMFSTCTIALRTSFFPRWLAYTGYACALGLVLIIANWKWITLVFPGWVLLLSAHTLLAELRPSAAQRSDSVS